ncbi:MAG TPA: hypothetical protein VEF76_00560, partial [Patescibacteria group bacterium]|nr:hypothetical protein [Patescibacteria group bacterium]
MRWRATALLALMVVAGVAQARVMIPREAQPAHAYFEMVREKKPCKAGAECFVEYLVLSNGLIVRKKIDSEKYDAVHPGFDIRRGENSAVATLFAEVAAWFAEGPTGGGSYTDPNNLYFYDGTAHQAFSSPEPPPEKFQEIFSTLGKAFEAADLAEDFYLHAYFQPLAGSTESFHLFNDGTFIASAFDRNSYKMTGTSIIKLPADTQDGLRALVDKARGGTGGGYMRCAASTGYEYALVEFSMGGKSLKDYTCGTGDGDFPA